jgi:hypothetical protein
VSASAGSADALANYEELTHVASLREPALGVKPVGSSSHMLVRRSPPCLPAIFVLLPATRRTASYET